MKQVIPGLAVLAALLFPSLASAEKAAPTPEKKPYFVANCFNCHGTDGRSSGAIVALAGIEKAYFLEQIKLFKSGGRQATVMPQLLKGYSDDEINIAAEFFARQKK